MDIAPFAVKKAQAHKLWKDYVQACKTNPNDKFLSDMKAMYNQLKSGRKVIDIYEVMKRGGVDHNYHPKLAIAQANRTTVYCHYNNRGEVVFLNTGAAGWYSASPKEMDIELRGVLPPLPVEKSEKMWDGKMSGVINLKTLVPKIPASLRPEGDLSKYYVLWEVDEWTVIEPPRDPYLLRRLSPNMFVVLAGWDLTGLERAVMKGRVHR